MSNGLYISKNALLIGFVTFFLISHAVVVFDAFHMLDLMMSIMRYLCFFIILAKYMLRPCWNKQDFLWVAFLLYLLYTTIAGSGIILGVVGSAIDITLLLMLFHVYEDGTRYILQASTLTMSFYAYLNLLLLLLYPDGLWTDPISGQGYFLLGGNYNGMGPRFVMALIVNMLILKDSLAAKINFICLLIVSIFSVLYVGSMTSTVGIVTLMLLWAFSRSNKHRQITILFFIVYILVQILVVFLLSDLSGSTFIVDFVENVLHKDLTFTKRTMLWENSSVLISESPWLGYGLQDKVWNEEQMEGPGSHNFVYTLLLYGGYPLLSIFILLLVSAIKNASSRFNENNLSRLLLGTNMLFFMMIFEYYTFFIEAFLVTLIYYYPTFSHSKQIE